MGVWVARGAATVLCVRAAGSLRETERSVATPERIECKLSNNPNHLPPLISAESRDPQLF